MNTDNIEIDNFDCELIKEYKNIHEIERVDYSVISYDSFFRNYISKNLPCIVKNVSDSWNCTNKWVQNDTICYTYFNEKYGDIIVPVADCDKISFNSQEKNDMKLCLYMQYLKETCKKKTLYLKDWHLRRIRTHDNFYEVPSIFASDWLNEYSVDKNEDDYMFVYIGPKDSWTPLHADVFSSYSWSVNVTGRKKWVLFPPGEEIKLKDSLGNLPLLYDQNIQSDIKYFEIIQERGDAIFVPSGWHHQVVNLIDTISINHNWINGCNVSFVWKSLLESLKSVEDEISDLRETSEYSTQCQIILKSLFGMDLETFTMFLLHISCKRLDELVEPKPKFSKFILGKNHIIFDLKCLLNVINDIILHQYSKNSLDKKMQTDLFIVKSNICKTLDL